MDGFASFVVLRPAIAPFLYLSAGCRSLREMIMRSRKYHALMLAPLLLAVLLVSGCDNQQEKEAKYLDRGNTLFDKQDYARARIEYKNAARIMPADAEVRYRMGLVDEAEGDLRAAFGNFMAAEQQNPKHYLAMKRLAQYFIAGDQPAEAQKRVSVLLQDLPSDADGHAMNAAIMMKNNQPAGVEVEAQKALSLDPKNVMAYSVLVGHYLGQTQNDKAQKAVEDAILQNPDSLPLYLLKAVVFEKAENIDGVAAAYAQVFRLRPDEARFPYELSKAYVKAGRLDSAHDVWREAIARAPANKEMKHLYVLFLSEHRGLDAAEEQVRAYIKANENEQDPYFWLAEIYVNNKATDKAQALLEEMVKDEEGEDSGTHGMNAKVSLARIHIVNGDKHTAEKLASLVLEKDPNNLDAAFIRARLFVDDGFYQDAVVLLRRIVRDNPKASEARQLLAEVLLQQGYVDLAVDTLMQSVEAMPTQLSARVRLAQMLGFRQDYPEALGQLDLVTRTDPAYAVGWEATARIATDAQNWSVAKEAIDKLEALPTQKQTAQLLRAQMAAARGEQEAALTGYKTVITDNIDAPLARHALTGLFDLLNKMGRTEELPPFLSSLPKQTSVTYSLLAGFYEGTKQEAEALSFYEKAIAAGADSAQPYLGMASIEIGQGKVDAAAQHLKKALELFPADARPGLFYADVLTRQKDFAQARSVYENLLARNPNNDIAANNMAQLIADQMPNDAASLEQARIAAERFIRSDNPAFLDTLAWVYFRQEKIDQALAIYERVTATDKPLPAPLYYHHGAALSKAGRVEEAKVALHRALADMQPWEGREEAANLLKLME